ncbi:MAG: hypothetical protein ACI9OJ_005685 [Myxococcota bacterium]|jgi:hypothetical protein
MWGTASMRTGWAVLWLGVALLTTGAARADALCVTLKAPAQADALRAFAVGEVRRHPAHEVVEQDCARALNIEVLTIGSRRYVTGWLDGQVPARIELKTSEPVEARLPDLVSRVLGSDPVVLADDMDLYLARIADSGLTSAGGVMLWGIEVFQTLSAGTSEEVDALPGIAIRLRRELGAFTVGARGAVSFFPMTIHAGERTRLIALMQIEPEFTWMTNPDGATSVYLGASLALAVHHFEGRPDDGGEESVTKLGVSVGARLGVELLRTSDFRLDLFAQVALPLFVSNSDESTIIDQWTPAGHLGMGVAF